MENALATALSWMPEVQKFCFCSKLMIGARNSLIHYIFMSLICIGKTVLLFEYHHEGETFIMYLQMFFAYGAAIMSFFTFYLALPLLFKITKNKMIPESTLPLLFILLCMILGVLDVLWGVMTFIRAFVDPGIYSITNESYNPYGKKKKKRRRGSGFSVNFGSSAKEKERKRKYEEWKKAHENDTIIKSECQWCDVGVATVYTLIQIFGFYLLICLKSFLTESDEDDEED